MRILDISAHETLEADQINIFVELGHEKVCSTGFFRNPEKPQTIIRPPTKNKPNYEFINKFNHYNPDYILPCTDKRAGVCFLPDDILKDFDIIVLNHYPHMLQANWPAFYNMKAKLIIRTLGFGNEMLESYYAVAKKLKPDIKIVRLSERERFCTNYCGEDTIIPQCYKPEEYLPWNGTDKKVLTVNKMFRIRAEMCGYDKYIQVTDPFKDERILLGNGNEDIPFAKHVEFDVLKQYLANSRCYLSTMSKTASVVTYAFIEALCTGIPVISYGNETGNCNGPTFGVDKIIENGINGYYSDDNKELQEYIRLLLNDHKLASEIGAKGKQKGLSLFHWDIIKEKWRGILDG